MVVRDGKAIITTAHHVRMFQPPTHSALDTAIAGLTDDFENEAVPRAFATGYIALTVPGTIDLQEDVPDLKGSIDVLGLNAYTRDSIRADLGSASLSTMHYRSGRPTNDQGWDLSPDTSLRSSGRSTKGSTCLLDNFEFADGFWPRFGLSSVDYANDRKRTATPAVETFKRISRNLR